MSPSLASSSTWAGSFFSSPLWKRVFSSSSTSPFFILAIASAAVLPMQSVAKATGRLMMSATAAATGLSELASSGPPLGRPKCASRMTLPPLSAISVMVGATRSMRVASVTRPFSVGTLRSTRNSTRLPATSASSSVRNGLLMSAPLKLPTAATRSSSLPFCHARERGHPVQPRPFERGLRDAIRTPAFAGATRNPQISFAIATAVSAMRFEKPHSLSYQESTRTKLPSMTLVWSRWKIEERSSWLKSLETLGWSV